jgi:hypothetical protein
MKTLSWNCRGLGKLSAVRALKQLILTHHLDMVFITETKFLRSDFTKKTNAFGLPNNFVVDCTITNRNRRGGIAMLWNNSVNINVIGFNNNMIDCYVEGDNIDNNWRATGIYGYPKHHQKHLTCELISQLYQSNNHDKWLLFGDFNLIMNSGEKQGGRDNHHNIINLAHNTLNDCNLVDLGYHGDPFTWTNNQEEGQHIKERLDRFCASPSRIARFPRYTNYHLINHHSDHNPILLVFGTNLDFREDAGSKSQLNRFENIWFHNTECLQIVKATWDHREENTKSKLQNVLNNVSQWGKATYGNVPREIKHIQNKIQELKQGTPTRSDLNQIHQLEIKLDGLLLSE